MELKKINMWPFGKNDWMTLETLDAYWTIRKIPPRPDEDYVYKTCFYKIQYSPSRGKTRIKTSGHQPKKHTMYGEALSRMAELNRKLLNNEKLETD